MGCGDSKPQPASPGAAGQGGGAPGAGAAAGTARKTREIDEQLKREGRADKQKIKMLLLGAGESGKSTIFKQMRLLYGTARSDDDLRMFGLVVRSNVVVAMRKLCPHLRSLGLEGEMAADEEVKQAYDTLMEVVVEGKTPPQDPPAGRDDWVGHCPRAGSAANSDADIFLAYHESIQTLWKSEIMQQVWTKRSAVNVVDAHKMFLDEIPRIASPDFKPTTQDVLTSRVRTTGIVKEEYRIDDTDFQLYDVGGQRSERRKWVNCFQDVTAVVFVAALSEYDQVLAEAKRSNRMVESLTLFQSVCNNHAFENTSILLFLNKRDVFEEKLGYSDIAGQKHFVDFAGPAKDYDAGVSYFVEKFKVCLGEDEMNDNFIHVTCATDTSNMKFVLTASSTIIKNENLKRSGFLGD